jgi:hypothetical protein
MRPSPVNVAIGGNSEHNSEDSLETTRPAPEATARRRNVGKEDGAGKARRDVNKRALADERPAARSAGRMGRKNPRETRDDAERD